ncbi:MAG TPA: hypothetical protein VGH00_09335, partial [Chthoniobacterales bacterium]
MSQTAIFYLATLGSNEFTDFFGDKRFNNLVAIRRSPRHRFSEVESLIGSDGCWEWRQEGINHGLNQRWTIMIHGEFHNLPGLVRVLERERRDSEATGDGCEVNRLEIAGEF